MLGIDGKWGGTAAQLSWHTCRPGQSARAGHSPVHVARGVAVPRGAQGWGWQAGPEPAPMLPL